MRTSSRAGTWTSRMSIVEYVDAQDGSPRPPPGRPHRCVGGALPRGASGTGRDGPSSRSPCSWMAARCARWHGAASHRAATDQVVDRLERQVVDLKERPQQARWSGAPRRTSEPPGPSTPRCPRDVATQHRQGQAVRHRADVRGGRRGPDGGAGPRFFVFVNAESERTAVLYRRRDGDYGLIEPTVGGRYSSGLSGRGRRGEAPTSAAWVGRPVRLGAGDGRRHPARDQVAALHEVAAERRHVTVAKGEAHVHVPLRVVPVGLEVGRREPLEDHAPLALACRDAHDAAVLDERMEHLLAQGVTSGQRLRLGHGRPWSRWAWRPSRADRSRGRRRERRGYEHRRTPRAPRPWTSSPRVTRGGLAGRRVGPHCPSVTACSGTAELPARWAHGPSRCSPTTPRRGRRGRRHCPMSTASGRSSMRGTSGSWCTRRTSSTSPRRTPRSTPRGIDRMRREMTAAERPLERGRSRCMSARTAALAWRRAWSSAAEAIAR